MSGVTQRPDLFSRKRKTASRGNAAVAAAAEGKGHQCAREGPRVVNCTCLQRSVQNIRCREDVYIADGQRFTNKYIDIQQFVNENYDIRVRISCLDGSCRWYIQLVASGIFCESSATFEYARLACSWLDAKTFYRKHTKSVITERTVLIVNMTKYCE